jgi:hypothetical protein
MEYKFPSISLIIEKRRMMMMIMMMDAIVMYMCDVMDAVDVLIPKIKEKRDRIRGRNSEGREHAMSNATFFLDDANLVVPHTHCMTHELM